MKLCVEAARPALIEANIPLMDYSRIRRWVEDKKNPCDLELDVLPALKRIAANSKIAKVRGWGYFEPAVLENRDRRLAGLPEPQDFENEKRINNSHQKPPLNREQTAQQNRRNTIAEVLAEREASRKS